MTRLSDLVRQQSKGSPLPAADSREARFAFQPADSQAAGQGGAPADSHAEGLYRKAQEEVGLLLRGARHRALPKLDSLQQTAAALADSLCGSDELLRKVLSGRHGAPLVDHAVNVAVLTIMIGLGLRIDQAALGRVALAALIHDVGMATIPESVLGKTEALTPQERALIEQHPQAGRDLLKGVGDEYEWLAVIVLQEHERWKGQGYPARLIRSDTHDFALMIGLADVFDALISPRPYRKALLPHHALRELLVNSKGMFPSELLKVLVDQLSMYPLGTTVRLNTGEIGIVNKLNRQYPLRPELHIDGAAGAGPIGSIKTIDLSQASAIHIVEVLRPANGQDRT